MKSALNLKQVTFQSFIFLSFLVCAPIGHAEHATATSSGAEWRHPGGTPELTRYSSLGNGTLEITPGNVGSLKEKFTISTGVTGGHQGQPLVVNIGSVGLPNVRLFYITPFPNKLQAIDPASGAVIWTFKPSVNSSAVGQACCDVVNRGIAYAKGNIVFSALDGSVFAVNATTGSQVWKKTGLAVPMKGETVTGAPMVVLAAQSGQKDLVIIGNAGAESGVRGWVQALDLNNKGAVVWKYFNTGSDKEVGITKDSALPTLSSSLTQDDVLKGVSINNKKDLGCTTWGDAASTANAGCTGEKKWLQGGSTVWAWMTSDSTSRIIYYGTANPGVWNPSMRPGSNKWSSSIVARNVDTGDVVWVNQLTPHDGWDFDSMNESILVTASGVKQLVHFDKNGFVYKFNATTGTLISALPFSDVTWVKRTVDGDIVYDELTGMPMPDPLKVPVEGKNSPLICPSPLGGKEFSPAAYSPDLGIFFVPGINFCSYHFTTKTDFIPGTPFVGDSLGFSPDFNTSQSPVSPITNYGFRALGELIAWDESGGKAWSIPENNPLWGGVLTTASGLVFYGTLDNHFKAVDARHPLNGGQPNYLLDVTLECGIIGNPITYKDNNGKQYVAVFTGVGWLPGMFTPGQKSCPLQGENANGSGKLHIFGL